MAPEENVEQLKNTAFIKKSLFGSSNVNEEYQVASEELLEEQSDADDIDLI